MANQWLYTVTMSLKVAEVWVRADSATDQLLKTGLRSRKRRDLVYEAANRNWMNVDDLTN